MSENTFGKYLKTLRKSFHYTQEFVASKLDISRQAYSHYETGRVIPPNDVCIRLAEIYQISAEDILHLALNSCDINISADNKTHSPDNIKDYISYIENETNNRRMKFLTMQEKELLYYFNHLSDTDQEDMLDLLKIKYNRTNKKLLKK